VKNAPTKEQRTFGKKYFGEKVQHNEEAYRIKNQSQQNPSTEWSPISETEVAEVLRMTLNWRAPDRFWLK
jgi:hypothetical protein